MKIYIGTRDENIYEIVRNLLGKKNDRGYNFRAQGGVNIPYVGFGTGGGLSPADFTPDYIEELINTGYVLFDSASAYQSEPSLGEFNSLKSKNRKKIFITTKIWYSDLGFEESQRALSESLSKLQTSYIDNWMIHWSECFEHIGWMDCSEASGKSWKETWELMQKLYAENIILTLGVSNYNENLLTHISEFSPVLPHIVQNYMDIKHPDWPALQFCLDNHILFQAYASLRSI
eukprot:UN23752